MNVEDVKTIAVVGAGIMGHGIAQVFAQAGYQVNLIDNKQASLQLALVKIRSELALFSRNHIITQDQAEAAVSRIRSTLLLNDAVRSVDFVIEAIKEDINQKTELFKELDKLCPKHAILATNTSSFSITELASVTNRRDQVVGMHWWNPPYLMPLVEIVKGLNTSATTVNLTHNIIEKLGKVPVVCKDASGFIGVRLQAALFIEAISILEQGLANAKDIDTTIKMTLGLRLPLFGPFEIVDMGGLDTFLYAYEYLHKKLGGKFKPPDLLKQLVQEGKLGLKTSKGFYEHTPESSGDLLKRRDEWLLRQIKERVKDEQEKV